MIQSDIEQVVSGLRSPTSEIVEAKHTPTPWTICGGGKCSCLAIWCPDHPIAKVDAGEWGDEYPAMRRVGGSLDNKYEAYMELIGYGSIDMEVARANGRFIVKAVNSYDEAMMMLGDVPGENLIERLTKLQGWYLEMQIMVGQLKAETTGLMPDR